MTLESFLPLAVLVAGVVNVAGESLSAVLGLEKYLRKTAGANVLRYVLLSTVLLTGGVCLWLLVGQGLLSLEAVTVGAIAVGSLVGFAADAVKLVLQLRTAARVVHQTRQRLGLLTMLMQLALLAGCVALGFVLKSPNADPQDRPKGPTEQAERVQAKTTNGTADAAANERLTALTAQLATHKRRLDAETNRANGLANDLATMSVQLEAEKKRGNADPRRVMELVAQVAHLKTQLADQAIVTRAEGKRAAALARQVAELTALAAQLPGLRAEVHTLKTRLDEQQPGRQAAMKELEEEKTRSRQLEVRLAEAQQKAKAMVGKGAFEFFMLAEEVSKENRKLIRQNRSLLARVAEMEKELVRLKKGQ